MTKLAATRQWSNSLLGGDTKLEWGAPPPAPAGAKGTPAEPAGAQGVRLPPRNDVRMISGLMVAVLGVLLALSGYSIVHCVRGPSSRGW